MRRRSGSESGGARFASGAERGRGGSRKVVWGVKTGQHKNKVFFLKDETKT